MKATELEIEERLDRVEKLLVQLPRSDVERVLAKEFGVSTRQIGNYIAKVYERWRAQRREDAPHRHEKLIRMAERTYAKTLADKKYGPNVQTLAVLARLYGVGASEASDREDVLSELGPIPTDPAQALLYGQRALLITLRGVMADPSLDPERRLRWIAEIGGKLGMTHAKAHVQGKLREIEGRLSPGKTEGEPDGHGDAIKPDQWDDAGGAGRGDGGDEPLPRPGAGVPAEDNGDVDPEGGGPVG